MATLNLDKDFLEFSKLLNLHEVRYLLIGGYAVTYHGYGRATADIDFWIAPDEANQAKAIRALRDFIYPSASEDLLREENAMLRFGHPPYRVEILKKISGLTFEEAWPNRVFWEDGDISIPIIGLADLRKNKAASARNKDLADLDNLPTPED